MNDLALGKLVILADGNYRHGPRWPAFMALLFGRAECFSHLGRACTIRWWKGQPYPTTIKEVAP